MEQRQGVGKSDPLRDVLDGDGGRAARGGRAGEPSGVPRPLAASGWTVRVERTAKGEANRSIWCTDY